jgi:RNA polymerase sigma-70 factor (ECF subfamily)
MSGHPLADDLPVAGTDTPAERLGGLFDMNHDRLYRLARRLVNTPDDASDLVQETFLRAAGSLRSIPHGSRNEEAWLVRVLINIRRDQWRKAGVRQRYEQSEAGSQRAAPHNPEASLIAKATVWRALDLLAPRRRAIVILHELEGLTASAIASLLDVSAITVRWHVSMGRRDLARALKPFMGGSHEQDQ